MTLPTVILVSNLQCTSQLIPPVHPPPVGSHLIKDCDFYANQMTNTTVGPTVRPQPVPTGTLKVKPVSTGKPKATPVTTGRPRGKPVPTGEPKATPVPTGKTKGTPVPTGKPMAHPFPTGKPTVHPVLTGKPKFTPVPIGRLHRPFLVDTDRGCSPSVPSGQYFLAAKDEGIFDSGYSRIMTCNKDRLDDFQAIHGGKVTFGGGEGRITRKGTIRTPTLDFENVYYDFKLPDDNMVVLKVPRKHNLYTINLNDLCPRSNLACLVVHNSFDECTQDVDSDSDYDEQVIIVPSYQSNSVQESQPIDTPGDKVDDSSFLFADEIFQKELAMLKDQEQRVTTDANKLRTPVGVKAVLSGCILVPTGRVPVPAGSVPVPTGSVTVTTDRIPVHAGDTTVPTDDVTVHSSNSTDLMFKGEPTTRFTCPSDLGNHNPLPGIFSSSSYDDEFDSDLNNVASSMEVSPVPTKRINTIHPQYLIIGDPTSVVQTRSMVKQNTTGDSAFISSIFDQQRDNYTDFQHCLFACFLS
nr:ribonuclease H-like domain-containing protein [Tanacetum cinerariifolium]